MGAGKGSTGGQWVVRKGRVWVVKGLSWVLKAPGNQQGTQTCGMTMLTPITKSWSETPRVCSQQGPLGTSYKLNEFSGDADTPFFSSELTDYPCFCSALILRDGETLEGLLVL